ncbi:hypothetical protein DHEL01_v207613 [Diaporthe helianthi]|uniref:Uncharacterized protein n=1 Tax=Diaporthe helianthi TaxID=158607 RepID=A0A2P5HUR1_DIAHE|nr:hypothetical protein DHEL01_v207613 [Diaporthe helianthi]
MISDHLHDAALALKKVLSKANVKFGVFGGYAVSVMGGVRESKDVDCLASVTKDQVVSLLDGKNGFTVIPQSRQDYVAFFWQNPAMKPGKNPVLVEIFCEIFPGSRYSMNNARTTEITIRGSSGAVGTCSYLEPFVIFKGKLRAAATRNKFHDAADLRKLGDSFQAEIKARAHELRLDYVGLAMKRNSALELLFKRLGFDTARAKAAVANVDPNKLPAPAPGDVQKGLLG